jgi:hypothetical protein
MPPVDPARLVPRLLLLCQLCQQVRRARNYPPKREALQFVSLTIMAR